MNRKKAILAIFMMAFLIIIGFVFPSIWKSQKGNKKSETENTQHLSVLFVGTLNAIYALD